MRRRMLMGVLSAWCAAASAQEGLKRQEWKVDGVTREALVYVPASAKTAPTPVVFGFHGHGGKVQGTANKFALHKHWPDAIVVYPQGLPSVGGNDPEGKQPGWQKESGAYGDRDLKLFDAMLDSLKKEYQVDAKRVFAMGHSNGGAFTYLLWAVRGDVLAGVGPISGGGERLLKELKPKPAFIAAGEKDPLVKIDGQRRVIEAVKKINGCAGKGEPWGHLATRFPSSGGTPLVAYVHPGGHSFPPETTELMMKFFREVGK